MIKKIFSFVLLLLLFGLFAYLVSFSKKTQVKAQSASFKFVVYSDSQYSYDSVGETFQRSVDAILNKVPNSERLMVFGLGDFTTSGLVTDTVTNHLDWTRWKLSMDNLVTDWSKTNPPQFVGTWGDHDTDRNNSNWLSLWSGYMSAQKNITAYSQYPSSTSGLYGSYKYQNALFLWLTSVEPAEEYLITNATNSSFFTTEETYISNILNTAENDSSIKWKFVFFHNPAEACNIGTKIDNERVKGWYNNYFIPRGVDMVFNGHTHSYVRTCPITNFVMGVGGATTCENFADNQVGDPQGVIEIMSTPVSAGPVAAGTCPEARFALAKRNFTELDINGDILNFKAWDVDDGGTNPTLMDSLTIDKTSTSEPTQPEIVKSADKTSAKSGDIINYTITYINGNQTVTGITVKDPIPSGTEYVSGGEQVLNNEVIWTYNDWAPNETGNFSFQVRVK